MHPDRATALLAVVRIICVLGLAFFIAGGIFLLLWWKPLAMAISFALSVPFFLLMRYMEKRHWEAEQASETSRRPESEADG